MIHTSILLPYFLRLFFCSLFFAGDLSVNVDNLLAFVFAADFAHGVGLLRASAIRAQCQNWGHNFYVTPCIASLRPVMSHSDYHSLMLTNLLNFANSFAKTGAVKGAEAVLAEEAVVERCAIPLVNLECIAGLLAS